MNETQARKVVETALQCGRNDGMEVGLEGQRIGFTRFSNQRITQNLSRSQHVLTIKACFGRREGTVKTTDLSPDCIAAMVAKAEEIARHAEENLEHVDPLEPVPVPRYDTYFEKTEKVGPFDRARRIRNVLARCCEIGHTCAGLIGNGTLTRAAGTSKGHFAYHRSSWARMHCTVLTGDSSGWRRVTSENIDDIDPDAVFEAALEKAERSMHPADVEPGRYTVVLEPAAVVDLLAFLFWSYEAKAAHEGRSFMSGRLGEAIADERVTVASVPGHPAVPGFPFQPDGLPAVPVVWIDRGRAARLVHDRFWAAKLGTGPTGPPLNVVMEGSEDSVDDLVAGVERGILVSRFWYVRYVEPMDLLLTGMTRDGTFLIENGRVTTGLKNLRWNDSVLRVLGAVEALGRPERQGEYMDALVPSLRVRDFHFTSKTLF